MFQIAPYNSTTVMNGDTFQVITLHLLIIMSVAEATDVVEVHTLDLPPACAPPPRLSPPPMTQLGVNGGKLLEMCPHS